MVEVDAAPGDDVHGGEYVGELAVASDPHGGDHGVLGLAGRELLAECALEDRVRRAAENARPDHRHPHAGDRESEYAKCARAFWS